LCEELSLGVEGEEGGDLNTSIPTVRRIGNSYLAPSVYLRTGVKDGLLCNLMEGQAKQSMIICPGLL
jgi:hypothetical protein